MKHEQRKRITNAKGNLLPELPLVTIVMCVYNAGEYLRPSVLSILGQTYQNLEIMIIDDGSTDGCLGKVEDLLADSRIQVFHQANASKPVAVNRALEQLRGEFYAIQDADDVSYPRRIENQVRAFLNRPQLAAVFCGNELIINNKSTAPVFAPKCEIGCKGAIEAFRMPALDPTGMFRMSLVGHLRYDVSLRCAETWDYILRVGEQHPMIVLGECLYQYRILPNSLSRRDPIWREQFVVQTLRQACVRRGLTYDKIFPNGTCSHLSKNTIEDNNIAAHFMKSVLDQRQAGLHFSALTTALDCVRLHPLDPHYYKAVVYALAFPALVDYLRGESGSCS